MIIRRIRLKHLPLKFYLPPIKSPMRCTASFRDRLWEIGNYGTIHGIVLTSSYDSVDPSLYA